MSALAIWVQGTLTFWNTEMENEMLTPLQWSLGDGGRRPLQRGGQPWRGRGVIKYLGFFLEGRGWRGGVTPYTLKIVKND